MDPETLPPYALFQQKEQSVSCGNKVKRYCKSTATFCADIFKKTASFICEAGSLITWFIMYPIKNPGLSILLLIVLFIASGAIVAPILDRVWYAKANQEWADSHQICQCKFITQTSVNVTCENKTEFISFTNGDKISRIVGVDRQCFIKHPINSVSDIADSNPYATYYFLRSGVPGLILWFGFGCIVSFVLLVIVGDMTARS